jgi:hypothetical protein
MDWPEKYGAIWPDESLAGWRTIYERHDATTDLVVVVLQHDKLKSIKADVLARQPGGPQWTCDFWCSAGVNAIFDDRSEALAIAHAEAIIRDSSPRQPDPGRESGG